MSATIATDQRQEKRLASASRPIDLESIALGASETSRALQYLISEGATHVDLRFVLDSENPTQGFFILQAERPAT